MANQSQHTLLSWLSLFVVALLVATSCSSATQVSGTDATPMPGTPTATETPSEPTETPTETPDAPTPGPTGEPTATPTPTATPRPGARSDVSDDGFVTHTLSALESSNDYFGLAKDGVGGQLITKFTITDFSDSAVLYWHDSNFFTLHDEMVWYQLLNGQSVPGSPYDPVDDLSFHSVEAVYRWAEGQDDLPIDLQLRNDGRLVITELYSLANADASVTRRDKAMEKLGVFDRRFAFGSLIHYPAEVSANEEDRWLIELEFSDSAPIADMELIFETLTAGLPDDIADQMEWVLRSPVQTATAEEMQALGHPIGDRVVRYEELAVPGEVQVYSSALTAGRVVRVGEGEKRGFDDTDEFSIILTNEVPDFLPPAAALITGVPQTPLAHVNILARNRGIPNAYRGGLLDDPSLNQMARVLAPALVYSAGTDDLRIVQLTEAQYVTWFNLREPLPVAVPTVDPDDLPYTIDLTELADDIDDQGDLDAIRPVIGGKAAGFIGLLEPGSLITPLTPLSITVRGFAEHQNRVTRELTAMLNDDDFKDSPRARFLLLEGREDYDKLYTDPDDIEYRNQLIAKHPPGTVLGAVLAADGFKKYFRDLPMDPDTVETITDVLTDTFGDYDSSQGLRFRSSSSVEDIEGFNGAGLYDSNTGFLDPANQLDEGDQKKSVEWALKKTWASYWSFEAFEERKLEQVDHLSGAMGVLVHARFDDELELSNGVFTLTVHPEGMPDRYVLEINAQEGDESVTNPTPGLGALPEAVAVRAPLAGGEPVIERVAPSTLVPQGTMVLDDDAVLEIFEAAVAVADEWLDRENEGRPPSRASSSLVLDFEYREMAEGWPALRDGDQLPERIVIKQARSLDPGTGTASDTLRLLPIPADALARARRIERRTCAGPDVRITTVEVTTDALIAPDLGHQEDPLVAQLLVEFRNDIDSLDIAEPARLTLDWRDAASTHPTRAIGGDEWDFETILVENDLDLETIAISAAGEVVFTSTNGESATTTVTCLSETLLTTPDDYLVSLLPDA